jgi:hypothetical protein
MAEAKTKEIGKVKLKNVRLSFAHLFKPQDGKVDKDTGKKGEPKFNCSFLFSKKTPEGKALYAEIKKAADEVKSKKWGNNIPKLKPEKICLRDGDQEEYDGYEGMYYLSASNNSRPQLVHKVKDSKGKWVKFVDPESGNVINDGQKYLYSGCYVNGIVKLWAQDNEHGKRLNASLELVQFLKHGDAFGAKQLDADDEIDDDDVEGFEDDGDFGGDDEEDDDDLL